MCYSNCPYEVWGGDNWGDCSNPKMQGTALAHCRDEESEVIDPEDEEAETPLCESGESMKRGNK